jgi:hypothetical protein
MPKIHPSRLGELTSARFGRRKLIDQGVSDVSLQMAHQEASKLRPWLTLRRAYTLDLNENTSEAERSG